MLAFCFACAGAAAGTPESASGESVRAVMTVRADPRTGRLVRVTEFRTAGGKRVPAAQAVRPLMEEKARKHAVDPQLVDAVIRAESGYNPAAVSVKGAAGLMQLMPATARQLGARNRFDPAENLEAGIKLLKQLQEKYGDERLALAAYNAGEGAVRKHGGVPPYRETVEYVRKIEAAYRKARPTDGAKTAELRRDEPEPVRSLLVETDAEGRVYLRTR
jgi:soluble lytic murein transglycosylase-like protein